MNIIEKTGEMMETNINMKRLVICSIVFLLLVSIEFNLKDSSGSEMDNFENAEKNNPVTTRLFLKKGVTTFYISPSGSTY
jgi:hypothetical protein